MTDPEPMPTPDHWDPDAGLYPQDLPSPDVPTVRILDDDADTEELHHADGTVETRPRTVFVDPGPLPDVPDVFGIGGETWANYLTLPRQPLWTPRQAVAQGKANIHRHTCPHYSNYGGLCLHFTACMYGFGGSGCFDAASHWRQVPNSLCHYEDMTPPFGSLAHWYGGSAGHGHISIVVPDDAPGADIVSNDIRGYGSIARVSLSAIQNEWSEDYKGWTPPYFPTGYGTNGQKPPFPAYSAADEWGRGDVYVDKLHVGVSKSDSVKRLKWRLIHHDQVPAKLRKGIVFDGDYGSGLREAVQHWQRHLAGDTADNPDLRTGKFVTNRQANRLMGGAYRVHEDRDDRHMR